MNSSKYFHILTLCLLFSGSLIATNLIIEWHKMKHLYAEFLREKKTYAPIYDQLVHPDWQKKCSSLVAHITGDPKENFLIHPILQSSMIRSAKMRPLSPEEDYLVNRISNNTKQLVSKYRETEAGGVPWHNKLFNTTGNSVGQMYFFAKLCELSKKPLTHIVEFGGGYGNLARIAKMCIPTVTYVIIDLPEICALQSLYLNLSLDQETITVHTKAPFAIKPGCINIVPVYLLPELNMNESDAFISTFAITESTLFSQNIVSQKNFFGSHACYIVGLASSPKWISVSPLISTIKSTFSSVAIRPYNSNSFIHEISGTR